MGFDNECILNIQSLAGEYFCPVCRTLVYPHEALQTQCTHLYCKPCLSYVVSSTQACPYDGYLVTEAGSKPLVESNKALAETIGKTTVHCLYHRSGCVWQGPLAECTTHCFGCTFGNSPVVCNRCGIQIVHRQVQEHAQTCNVNGSGTAQDAATSGVVTADQSKTANQAAATAPASQPPTSHMVAGPAATQNLNQNQPATANPVPQGMPAPAVLTPEQQYYQQYYQQYPGYDPYQQAYQQYYPYQQQPPVQSQPQPQLQQQVQAAVPQAQNHPLAHSQGEGQGQPQPQTHPQTQSQIQVNGQPQPQSVYPQATAVGTSQNQGQVNSQPHMPVQSYSQIQPQVVQNHAQPPNQVPQYQQPHPQMQHPQPPQVQPYPQTQPQPQLQPQPQTYPQPHSNFQPHSQPQLQPTNPQHPPGGNPSYPSQPHQQMQHAPPQQNPMQVQPQFPPPPPHMRPPQPPHMLPPQQRPVMHQVQQPTPPQYMQQPQAFPGQMPGQFQGQPTHAGPFAHQHHQVRPQVPPQPMQQPTSGFVQPQQGNALPHGMPPQSYVGRPAMANQGGQPPQYSQSSGSGGIAPPGRPLQFGSSQPSVNRSNVTNQYAPPLGGEQTFERRVEQDNKSPSLKKSEQVINDFGANSNEVKPEAGVNDEHKSEDRQRKDEALAKDTASDFYQAQGADSAMNQRVKEENKDEQGSSQAGNGPFTQPQATPQRQINDVSGAEQRRSTHPPVPFGFPGQTMGQSPSHLRPHGRGYLPHGPHPGEQFQPPVPPGGPNSFANSRVSRMSQGDPLGPPPPPHGPDSQRVLRHSGPMESDIYQNQRPPYSDSRRQDSHLRDRGPYGAEFNSMRMNGATPPGLDSSSASGFYDEKFRTSDVFPMPQTRHREETFKQFHGPPNMGNEEAPKFGSHFSRPSSGYGIDGPLRFNDKDPHGYDAGQRLPPYHPNEPGGRPFPASIHDNRGRFDNNRQNPDFLEPMHGYSRRHMDRLPPINSRNPFVDVRNMERQPFDERFPMGPLGPMHRGEFDGPRKPMNGEPGFGPFHDYGHFGEPNGPGGFSHHPRFGEQFSTKSTRPHLDEPVFRSSYSRPGFTSDGGYHAGGADSFDPMRKSTMFSMGWCRICKVDCETVEGLDMHGQTREHQRMSMDMVISIKKKNAKRQKASIDREEANKFRN